MDTLFICHAIAEHGSQLIAVLQVQIEALEQEQNIMCPAYVGDAA